MYILYTMFLYMNGLQNVRVAIGMAVLMVGGCVLTGVFKNLNSMIQSTINIAFGTAYRKWKGDV